MMQVYQIKLRSVNEDFEMEADVTKVEKPHLVVVDNPQYTKLIEKHPHLKGVTMDDTDERPHLPVYIILGNSECPGMSTTEPQRVDYEELCKLDVIGLADSPAGDQGLAHDKFNEQLWRSEEGWYETGLPWKGDHPPLPVNKDESLRRLTNLVRKLERSNTLNDYNAVI